MSPIELLLTRSVKKKSTSFTLTLVAVAVLSGFSATSVAAPQRFAELHNSDVLLLDTASVNTPREGELICGFEIGDLQTETFAKDPLTITANNPISTVGIDTIGLHMEGRAVAHFTGKEVTITGESASNVYPVEETWPQTTSGIELFGPGVITSSAETNLNISAVSTGEGSVLEGGQYEDADPNNFAGFVFGLGTEGGTIDLKGNTTISATGKGAYAVGMKLQAVAGDDDWIKENIPVEDFSLNATFGGDLTVTATSETGGAEAIRLGGFVPGSDGYGFEQYPEGVTVTMNTSATGVTTISASTGTEGFESVGVNFAYPDPEGDVIIDTPEEFTTGRGHLNLNGTTIITADHAFKGDVGYITNKGNLTLNGRVDQFKGEFTQTAGSTKLNDSRFFGGAVTLESGTIDASMAAWLPDTETQKLNVSGAIPDGKADFALNKGVVVNASGDASMSVNGDSYIGGTLTGLKEFSIDNGRLVLDDGADVNVAGNVTIGSNATFGSGQKHNAKFYFQRLDFLQGATFIDDSSKLGDQGAAEFGSGTIVFHGDNEINVVDGSGQVVKADSIWMSEEVNAGDPPLDLRFEGGSFNHNILAGAGTLTITNGTNFTADQVDILDATIRLTAGEDGIGNLTVKNLNFNKRGEGKLELAGGSLTTSSDQIFNTAAGSDVYNPDGLKNDGRIEFTSGTLVLNDADHHEYYADWAGDLIG